MAAVFPGLACCLTAQEPSDIKIPSGLPDSEHLCQQDDDPNAPFVPTKRCPKWLQEYVDQALRDLQEEQQRHLIHLQEVVELQEHTKRELLLLQQQVELIAHKVATERRAEKAEKAEVEVPSPEVTHEVAPPKNSRRSLIEAVLSAMRESDQSSLTEDVYEFKRSIWSAATFIFSPVVGLGSSGIVAMLVVFTMVMQIVFCCLVLSIFTELEFSPEVIDGLHSWRYSIGHNLRYIDDLSSMSLVSRVCSISSDFHHATLELSTQQASHVKLIRNYLRSAQEGELSTLQQLWPGPLLCIFVLLCYYAVLAQEFHDIIRMVWAFTLLPRGKFITAENDFKDIIVESVGWPRLLFVMVTVSFRAVIAGMLGYAGTVFIVNTLDMRDLLMNAVALAFVLEVDELLFATLAPVQIRNVIRQVKPMPLRLPRGRIWRNLLQESFSLATIAGVLVSLALVYRMSLSPFIHTLRTAEMAICGGRQDFVFAVDGFGTVSWAESQPVPGKGFNSTHLTRALHEVIDGDIQMGGSWNLSRQVDGIHRLHERQAKSIADIADEGQCVRDSLDAPMIELFRERFGDQMITNCSDILHYCDDGGVLGIRTRLACQRTCGCSTFTGRQLFHRNPQLGCGRKCHETYEWLADTPSDACRDASRQTLVSAHQSFIAAINASSEKQAEGMTPWQDVAEEFRLVGCEAVARVHANHSQDLCLEKNLRPVLLTLCPVTCGCWTKPELGCPMICFSVRYGSSFALLMSWVARSHVSYGRQIGQQIGRQIGQEIGQEIGQQVTNVFYRRRRTPPSSAPSQPDIDDNASTVEEPSSGTWTGWPHRNRTTNLDSTAPQTGADGNASGLGPAHIAPAANAVNESGMTAAAANETDEQATTTTAASTTSMVTSTTADSRRRRRSWWSWR